MSDFLHNNIIKRDDSRWYDDEDQENYATSDQKTFALKLRGVFLYVLFWFWGCFFAGKDYTPCCLGVVVQITFEKLKKFFFFYTKF